jgi:hypothetical protein
VCVCAKITTGEFSKKEMNLRGIHAKKHAQIGNLGLKMCIRSIYILYFGTIGLIFNEEKVKFQIS